jgi:hypothetical protein
MTDDLEGLNVIDRCYMYDEMGCAAMYIRMINIFYNNKLLWELRIGRMWNGRDNHQHVKRRFQSTGEHVKNSNKYKHYFLLEPYLLCTEVPHYEFKRNQCIHPYHSTSIPHPLDIHWHLATSK